MMIQRLMWSLAAVVVAIMVGSWLGRVESPAASPLVIRRLAPTDVVLRGSPGEPVQVELELTNTTDQPLELAPLRMSCSCQIAKSPAPVIAAGGTTQVSLSLRYPPAQNSLTPVEFKSPAGVMLARTEIALEVNRAVPYFADCPEHVEIPLIAGVSDHTWNASAATVELVNQPFHVQGARVTDGTEFVRVTLTSSENSHAGTPECQRTYQMAFELLDAAVAPSAANSLHGLAVLELLDGTEQQITWSVTRRAPLALVFDHSSGSVRGVRRSGAQGAVTLHCVPEGSGTLIPDRFDSGQSIVAKLQSGAMRPQAVEARYQGTADVVPVVVSIP